MKKLLLIMIVLLALPVAAMAQRQAVGGTLDYVGKNRSIGLSMFYQYRLTSSLRIAPDLGFDIRHHDINSVHANINLHMPLNMGTGGVDLYPLLGLNLSRWMHYDPNVHCMRVGLNAGAGFQLRMSSSLLLKGEAKYVITKNYSSLVTALGVGYVF